MKLHFILVFSMFRVFPQRGQIEDFLGSSEKKIQGSLSFAMTPYTENLILPWPKLSELSHMAFAPYKYHPVYYY